MKNFESSELEHYSRKQDNYMEIENIRTLQNITENYKYGTLQNIIHGNRNIKN